MEKATTNDIVLNPVNRLLSKVEILVKEDKRKAEENFEHFNIFSILKLENKENRTHSAFIAYLLDPRASHKQGSMFIDLFLKQIKPDLSSHFVTQNASVETELHIGYKEETPDKYGRIDLHITDSSNNLIVIENKINAGDQEQQIKRYHTYCKESGRSKYYVFYLTLFGTSPCKTSSADLNAFKDYDIISYKYHIISWLEECEKKTTHIPVLYQSIKQYKLLIYKLTNTLMQASQLTEEMLNHFEAAQYINKNFDLIKSDICQDIRKRLILYLTEKKGDKHEIVEGRPIDHPHAQIEIFYKSIGRKSLYFGIDSFSYNNAEDSVDFGIYNANSLPAKYFFDENEENKHSEDPNWPYYMSFAPYNELEIRFDKPDIFLAWYKNENDFKKGLIEYLGKEFILFLEKHEHGLEEFLSIEE